MSKDQLRLVEYLTRCETAVRIHRKYGRHATADMWQHRADGVQIALNILRKGEDA